MKQILVAISLCCLFGCSYEYMSMAGEKSFRKNYHSVLLASLTKQIHAKDAWFGKDSTLMIYIEAIESKSNGIGVYGYNSYGTHFGHVKFFEYKNNTVTLLNRDNLDSLQSKIGKFLKDADFSDMQIQITEKRMIQVWKINATDSF